MLAATTGEEGHPETVDLLLDRGVDSNALMKHRTALDRTALDRAARFGQEEMVHRLLRRGAVPSAATLAAACERLARHPESRRTTERITAASSPRMPLPARTRNPGRKRIRRSDRSAWQRRSERGLQGSAPAPSPRGPAGLGCGGGGDPERDGSLRVARV
ncbi:ankyrin repeat domain-containing protein [Streptomyces uncialis]|uniref:ankyrin repeat domain-containing protein n=1 Tax=Streptomyces uncialis TaxID=1048205 RepID=UPI003659EC1D